MNQHNQKRQELKRARRAERERALATATLEASRTLGRKLYGVILADPPWSFQVYNDDTGQDRGAVNHYPVMSLADIKALKIPAAKDAVLFLWATVPMLPQVLEVMAAWGFQYKSSFVWVKDKTGLGFWNRNRHELLLIGTRGDVPAPAPGENFNSVIEAPRGRHSEKPAIVRQMIATMFPNTPKLEMFARGERVSGWDFWGNEISQPTKPDNAFLRFTEAQCRILAKRESLPPNRFPADNEERKSE